MSKFHALRLVASSFLILAVAACDNAEDRARGHHERGMAYMESNEVDKAVLEFRNALLLDPDATETRLKIARLMMEMENYKAALGNYLRVVDQVPDMLEARVAVARIQIGSPTPEAATEHVTAALRLAPDDTEVRGLQAALAQRLGQSDEAAQLATALLADAPDDVMGALVLAAYEQQQGNHEAAIALLDKALVTAPDDWRLHVARLRNLEDIGDQARIGAQLETMAGQFPDRPEVSKAQVQWHLNQKDGAGAVAAQRRLAAQFADDPGHMLDLVSLLRQFDGLEVARAELKKLSAESPHRLVFARALADLDFASGAVDTAVAGLETLAGTELTEQERRDVEMQQAGFLWDSGNRVEAEKIATAVLAEDANHVDALRMRAGVAIEDDRPDDAIADLRLALGFRPQDPGILMLLATAHERNGSPGLAQERLALAVQSSDAGIVESLAYADFLVRTRKIPIAQDVLEDTLSKRGDQLPLLIALGRIQLEQSDWGGATATAARIGALEGDPTAARAASELRLAVLSGQRKYDESIGLLRSMWEAEGERTSALEGLVSNYLRSGEIEKAQEFLLGILEDEPKSLRANLLLGAVMGYAGDGVGAEAQYRKVIADHPERANGYGALATLLRSLGRQDEADSIVLEGIENADNAERLLFFQAGRLEEQRNFDGAIAIYEQLYTANKLSDVLANNLASLLSEHGTEPDALDRAHAIARRLASNPEPAFQDTYGWILYLRGDYEQALQPLQAAAAGASGNAIVQFHFGMVLEKLGQKEKAIEVLSRAVELGAGGDLPQMEEADATLEALRAQ